MIAYYTTIWTPYHETICRELNDLLGGSFRLVLTQPVVNECNLGWITNTTLMVTMPDCDKAVALAQEGGFNDRVGLHINIYGGEPLTERIRHCPNFCGDDGLFNHAFSQGLVKCWTPLSQEERSALYEEVEAQCERFVKLGLPVRHFDSHHHSHMIMRVLPTICDAAASHGFKTIRRGINVFDRKTLRRKVYYSMQDFLQCQIMGGRSLSYTDYMCDFFNFKKYFNNFREDDTVELMVHPFYEKNGKLDDAGEMSDSGLRKMEEVVDFITCNRKKIQLVSFADFAK